MIYQWPQGRVLRTIAVILVLVISADLGWGAWGQLWCVSGSPRGCRLNGTDAFCSRRRSLFSILFVVVCCCVVMVPRSSRYLIEVEQEMRKVTWPDRPTVIRSAIVISIMTVCCPCSFLVSMRSTNGWFTTLFTASEGTPNMARLWYVLKAIPGRESRAKELILSS